MKDKGRRTFCSSSWAGARNVPRPLIARPPDQGPIFRQNRTASTLVNFPKTQVKSHNRAQQRDPLADMSSTSTYQNTLPADTADTENTEPTMLQSIITKASKSVAPDFTVLAHTFCNPGAVGHLGVQKTVTLYWNATYEDPTLPYLEQWERSVIPFQFKHRCDRNSRDRLQQSITEALKSMKEHSDTGATGTLMNRDCYDWEVKSSWYDTPTDWGGETGSVRVYTLSVTPILFPPRGSSLYAILMHTRADSDRDAPLEAPAADSGAEMLAG